MTKIYVKPNIIRWASDRSGSSISALEKHFPKIRSWIREQDKPTLKQVEKLARRTNTPFGYFFLSEPPEEHLPIPFFRTVGEEGVFSPSPNLLDTMYVMQQRQEWMRDFLVEQGQAALPFVASAKINENLQEVANDIRKKLGLTEQWAAQHTTWTAALRELYQRIEKIGVLVVASGVVGNNPHRKLDINEFRGFVLYDELAPLIFVNSVDGKAAQMFTLAHEIAHIWFGSSAAFDLRELQPATDATEQVCNAVAAEVLVPEAEFRRIWPDIRREDEPFQLAARNFKVSPLVAARRALDLGLVSRTKFLDFYATYENDERRRRNRKDDGGDFWANQNFRIGRRFGVAVVNAVKEGKLLYNEAYRLTGLSGKTFEKYAENLLAA